MMNKRGQSSGGETGISKIVIWALVTLVLIFILIFIFKFDLLGKLYNIPGDYDYDNEDRIIDSDASGSSVVDYTDCPFTLTIKQYDWARSLFLQGNIMVINYHGANTYLLYNVDGNKIEYDKYWNRDVGSVNADAKGMRFVKINAGIIGNSNYDLKNNKDEIFPSDDVLTQLDGAVISTDNRICRI